MSHHIYHTRGIILASSPSGEANRFYKIFTEELGLVGATAQSVREGKSKLRYALQDFSIIFADLVRGKEVWRITSAGEIEARDIRIEINQRKLFVYACTFASRLLQGESREEDLFEDLLGLEKFLKTDTIPVPLLAAVEALSSLRAVNFLGYADALGYEAYLKSGDYSVKIVENFNTVLATALQLIDKALISSHL